MKPLVILYATREGQTRRIAERLAAHLRARGAPVDLADLARGLPQGFELAKYAAVVVAAAIHIGKHAPEAVAFVREHRSELARVPTMFLSVSLSAAGASDPSATAKRRTSATANRDKMIAEFLRQTRWTPSVVHPVAGALLYQEYGFFVRQMMRFISSIVGASTDTSRNHEYTDWKAVDAYAEEFAETIAAA
jgi:menaquinone-dependent protoporphyrinogen oxidase